MEYIKEKSAQAARVLSGKNDGEDAALAEALDWSHLKHKELDEVLEVILQWRNGDNLDMEKYWDTRLRNYYKTRYDYRKNAADWDYHMKMKKMSGEIINSREFMKWRLFGIAFEFRDTTYTVPNVTMGTWVQGRRNKTKTSCMARGFWSDIINSPYLAFGLKADYEKLFKVRNKEQVHTSCDVSQYNVTQMLHAIHTGTRIQPRVIQSGMGSMGDDAPSEDDLNAVNTPIDPANTHNPLKMVLLLGDAPKLLNRNRYEGLFDAAIVSNLAAGQATEWMNKTLNRGEDMSKVPTVTIETAKFALDFKPDQKTEFVRRCYKSATEAGWLVDISVNDNKVVPPVSGEMESQMRFVYAGEDGLEHWNAIPELPVPEGYEEEKKPNAEDADTLMGLKPEDPEAGKDGEENLETPDIIKAKEPSKDQVKTLTDTEITVIQRNPDRVTRRPRELLIKVRLPGLDSAAGVDIDIDVEAKTVKVDHLGKNLHAEAKLGFQVDEEKGNATFNTDTSTLTLILPVIAPKVEEKDALQHLEGAEEGTEEAPNGEKENPMVTQQRIGGMAIPAKLGIGY